MSELVRTGQDSLGQVRIGHDRTGNGRTGHDSGTGKNRPRWVTYWDGSGRVRKGTGQVKTG